MSLLAIMLPFAIALLVLLLGVGLALVVHHRHATYQDRVLVDDEQPWPPELPTRHDPPPHPDGGVAL